MEFLTSVFTVIISYGPPFLFVLTVVVFFHELGHFLIARWCGIGVETFSVGFGRELIGWTDRQGTRWKVSLIPLGGYVKFEGDSDETSTPDQETIDQMTEAERARSFHTKPLWARSAVVAGGPIANFILAIVIFSAVFAINGRQLTAPIVDKVNPGSAAEEAGLKTGDRVVSIDGAPIESFLDLQRIVSTSADLPLKIDIDRGGEVLTLDAIPKRQELTDRFGNKQSIGVLGVSRSLSEGDIVYKTYSLPEAVVAGTQETWFVMERTVIFIGGLFTGRESVEQLGGPIRIAQVSGQVATLGFLALINLAALLSVSIGLLNLFPIPILDGGRLVFYGFEAVLGRPLSARTQDIGFRIGFAVVIMLMIFATWNDTARLLVQ